MNQRWGAQWQSREMNVGPASPPNGRHEIPKEPHEWRSAMSLAMFAFALVLIMAAALFVTVGFNPKNASYGKLPWLYASASLVGSTVCWAVSRRLDRKIR